jgi:hypothetical protein
VTNRSKSVGTRAETLIVRYARAHGFGGADRLTLTGRADRGDIGLCPGVIAEVKAGRAAEQASDALIGLWLAETEAERVNARAHLALLVTKRAGCGAGKVGQWWVHCRIGDITLHHPQRGRCGCLLCTVKVRLTLADALAVLRRHGYGDPLSLPEDQSHREAAS